MTFAEERGLSSVRAICPRPGGGRVITMGFPGLDTDPRGNAWLNPERLDATLTEAIDYGLQLLIILARAKELPTDAHASLRRAASARNLRTIALPIEDYGVPGRPFLRAWRRLSPAFRASFAADQAIGMSCHHGAGRSGVVAAMHLIEAGATAADAVAALRAQFPETVENDLQYLWLEHFAS